eukprot:gene25656-biopygen4514
MAAAFREWEKDRRATHKHNLHHATCEQINAIRGLLQGETARDASVSSNSIVRDGRVRDASAAVSPRRISQSWETSQVAVRRPCQPPGSDAVKTWRGVPPWPVGQMDPEYRVYLVDPPGGGGLRTPAHPHAARSAPYGFVSCAPCVCAWVGWQLPASQPTNQPTDQPTNLRPRRYSPPYVVVGWRSEPGCQPSQRGGWLPLEAEPAMLWAALAGTGEVYRLLRPRAQPTGCSPRPASRPCQPAALLVGWPAVGQSVGIVGKSLGRAGYEPVRRAACGVGVGSGV